MSPGLWLLGLACTGAPEPSGPQGAVAERPPGQPGPPGPNGPPGRPGGAASPKPHILKPTFELVGQPSETLRSVVIISLDTTRADRLAVYGGRAETPNLTAFTQAGARFDAAFTHFPETCPAHWSMMSGVPPELHGNVGANRGSLYTGPTIAEIAKQGGYATAAFIGGVTLQDVSCGFSRGFDNFDDRFDVDTDDMRRPAAEVTAAATTWMSAQTGPFFAFVHYFDAHFPYTPTAPWDTRYDPDYTGTLDGRDRSLDPYRRGDTTPSPRDVEHILALYDGELSELDASLKPLLAAIPADAVVIITADHGESFEHDYYFNHRGALWDPVIRVPLLVRAPGVPAGAVVTEQVGLIDVAPTALQLAGLPLDGRMMGRDLTALTRGEGEGRAVIVSNTDPWMSDAQESARGGGLKRLEKGGAVAVYDLSADPGEQRPLTGRDDALAAERAAYEAQVTPLKVHQGAPPANAIQHSPEERAQLEALGYIPAGDGKGRPPGPPPQGPGQGPPGPPPGPPKR
ncbi:sulfatase [Myxococcota bacterium]|nr:sulfatase [Myxococcota bacterium]